MLHINIRISSGDKLSVDCDANATIAEFKNVLAEKSGVPPLEQRLIYKGRVLKDDETTLASYGLENDHTIHLVRGKPPGGAATTPSTSAPAPSSFPPPTTAPASSLPAPTTAPVPNPFGGFGGGGFGAPPAAGANPFGGGFGGSPFGGGMNADMMANMQRQMMENPDMMRQMMESPMMQSMLSNPEMMRSAVMNNPMLRNLMERNPEVGRALADPDVLRQTMEAVRNPNVMREMMRNSDRSIHNAESSPEGFNALRQIYADLDASMESAANEVQAATNPGGSTGTGGSSVPTTAPNTNALPNPWGAAAPASGAAPPNPFGASPFGGFGAPGTANPFGGGFPGPAGMNPGDVSSMLSNPMFQQAIQQVSSNPAMLESMLSSNPMMQQALASNPQMRTMLSNPDFVRQAFDPRNIQAMLQMQQAMQQLQASGLMGAPGVGAPGLGAPGLGGANPFGANPFAAPNPFGVPPTTAGAQAAAPGSTTAPPPFDLNAMMAALGANGGAMPGFAAPATNVPVAAPEVRFAVQLQKLSEMGFVDRDANINALVATNGNVNAAIDRLLSGGF